jgi:Fic family protein
MKADILTVLDRDELPGQMEPLVLSEKSAARFQIPDLVLDVTQKSAALKASLPPSLLGPIADLVRSMNCYYSNLIEGHNTHPVDIERALRKDYSSNPQKRDLQLEAHAHIAVQQWMDEGGLSTPVASVEALLEIHRRFCAMLPADLLWVEDPASGMRHPVVPGELRTHDVKVGNHVPVSPGALPRFLSRFEKIYTQGGRMAQVGAAAAAHHRLLWVHPFADGNGRVARLMSHGQLRSHLDTGSLWSVARGLARNVGMYKQLLANCDRPRENDLDGRGSLSEVALAHFTEFFLKTCIDQVEFTQGLLKPQDLQNRIRIWAEEEIQAGRLPQHAELILQAILFRGELQRSEIPGLLGVGERQARRIVADLAKASVVTSETSRSPIRLRFPATLAERWLPGLFPPHAES